MKKELVISVVLACTASGALAADVDKSVAHDWTGVYFGPHAGYASGKATAYDDDESNGNFWAAEDGKFGSDVDGLVGGAQIGANYQIDRVVLSLEVDFGWLDVSGDGNYEDEVSTTQVKTDGGSYRMIRGRFGVALDRLMIFGTGGVITADLESTVFDDENNPILRDIEVDTWRGRTIGGGLEYAFDDSWTFKVEYLYYDLGKERNEATFGDNPGPDDIQSFVIKNKGDIVRVGLNLHF